ncbi:MAG: Ig-like domain-containing protein [Acutalibacteraceae bacterium]|nr:Ig-like domain-containing protein [Acutalibacteraceae bacterium]
MKKGKIVLVVMIIAVLLLAMGGVYAYYALNTESVTLPSFVNNILNPTTEPVTEPTTIATEPITEAPTDPIPEINASISAQELSLTSGQTAQINAEIKNQVEGKNYNIRYTTSNENIASIDSQGLVTPMSKGECKVGVYVEGYESSIKNFDVTVSDPRIDQINILNSYLNSLKTKEEYKYSNNKTGYAKLDGCKIADFNNDGSYELFIVYKLANDFQKVQVVTVFGNSAVINQTSKSYKDIANGGYSKYVEEIYVDGYGEISIISEQTKIVTNYTEKNTVLYTIGGNALTEQAKYYCKEPSNIGDITKKSEYKVDDVAKTRDEFTMLYTSLKSSREISDDYISITASLSEGNYTKAQMPCDLGTAYYNRIKWTSSDVEVAKVSDSGIVTGGNKLGSCTITGKIQGIDIPMCKMTIEVTDVSDEFGSYIDEIKDDVIIGESGNKMKLYAYYVADIDGDSTTDLLLYYTGGNGCQLDMVHFVGTKPSRQTIKSVTTENKVACMLELYTDSSSNNATVLYVGEIKVDGNKNTTSFRYETYSNGTFYTDGSVYTIISDSGKRSFKVGEAKVKEEDFNNMLIRYRKIGDWKKIG